MASNIKPRGGKFHAIVTISTCVRVFWLIINREIQESNFNNTLPFDLFPLDRLFFWVM